MTLNTIKGYDFTQKRVVMRVDFNILLDEKNDARDIYKLKAVQESIDYILSFDGVRLALISHRGRPTGQNQKHFTMAYLADDIARILNRTVHSVCDCVGVCVVDALEKMREGEVLLLENLRFHKEEKADDELFAQQLAAPFDVYVNEAFSVCHRAHASVHAITKYLPSYAGLWLAKEVANLERVRRATEHPSVAIIGGAKIDTKVPLISAFEKSYDTILVGGRVAIEAQQRQMTFAGNVVLPTDYSDHHFDIGAQTIRLFQEKIAQAKIIVWNGPMGKFEEAPYDRGTRALAQTIGENTQAFSVVGGGESVQALHESGYFDAVSFVSTGGGAMLSFLSGEPMPGLDVLITKYSADTA